MKMERARQVTCGGWIINHKGKWRTFPIPGNGSRGEHTMYAVKRKRRSVIPCVRAMRGRDTSVHFLHNSYAGYGEINGG